MDRYENFAQLNAAEREGIDFEVCVLARDGVSTVILALHGGGIEPGTSIDKHTMEAMVYGMGLSEGKGGLNSE